MEKEENVIEVEAISVTTDEKKKPEKSRRIKHDHRRTIYFLGLSSKRLLQICVPMAAIGTGLGLTFSILYSENMSNIWRLAMMISSWGIVGLAFAGIAISLIFRLFMRSLKKRDPNFEDKVKADDVYE